MSHPSYRFSAELFRSGTGPGTWVMLAVPFEQADAIDDVSQGSQHGFGSVRVEVSIGTTTWRTSLFPDSRRQSFIMGVKQSVRRAEGIDAGDVVDVEVTLVDVDGPPDD